ncbi:expressed unknown protein [Seminavis robusta]|uniref:Uncharacterized protein n=1 Tax=Seminavis robusta TaxID=568900 RepID=A0A9N8DK65_9STRA|nr:expressed unknown protein [Seminavis robusta]|eukprot:Sro203_g085660.1 n/a (220) ;mRNA; r:74690-75558
MKPLTSLSLTVLDRTASRGLGKALPTGSRALSTFLGTNYSNGLQHRHRSLQTNAAKTVHFHSTSNPWSSPFDTSSKESATTTAVKKSKRRKFVPPKAAVKLTDKARKFFKLLLENPPRPDIVGVMLNYDQASSGQPRMVFSFDFVSQDQIAEDDEGVSLELLDDGTPKPPKDSMDDGLPKLYINHNGFMKALGCTVDIDIEQMKPILYDPSGNEVNPNV